MSNAIVPAGTGGNLFAGFDDWMEKKEPGWKARQAEAKQARESARLDFRRALIRRYGSKAKAEAPTAIELAIITALKPFEVTTLRTYANGTFASTTLAGWSYSDIGCEMPPQIVAAAQGAMPMPETTAAAGAEYDWWQERDAELQALAPQRDGDYLLDQACILRMEIVRKLLETGLRARCIADVLARQRYSVASEYSMPEVDRAVLEDLEHLAAQETSDAG